MGVFLSEKSGKDTQPRCAALPIREGPEPTGRLADPAQSHLDGRGSPSVHRVAKHIFCLPGRTSDSAARGGPGWAVLSFPVPLTLRGDLPGLLQATVRPFPPLSTLPSVLFHFMILCIYFVLEIEPGPLLRAASPDLFKFSSETQSHSFFKLPRLCSNL